MGCNRSRVPLPHISTLTSGRRILFSICAEHLSDDLSPTRRRSQARRRSRQPLLFTPQVRLTLSRYYLTLWEPETLTIRATLPLSHIAFVEGLSQVVLVEDGVTLGESGGGGVFERFGIRIVGVFQDEWRSESFVFQHVSDVELENLFVNMVRFGYIHAVIPPELRRENVEKYELFENEESDENEPLYQQNYMHAVSHGVDEDFIHSEFGDFVKERIKETGSIFLTTSSPRKMLLVVNPTSGLRNSEELYRNRMMQCLNSIPNFSHDVVITESAGHATEIMRRFDFSKYNEVGVVGGDGTVNEVLQGLLSHVSVSPMEAFHVPVAVFPGGNGNALGHYLGGSSVEHGCLLVARGKICRQDVATAFNSDSRRFCFLSLTLGVGADVDLGLECLCCKKLGLVREAIGGILALVRMRFIRINCRYVSDRENNVRRMGKVPPPRYHSMLEDGHPVVNMDAPYRAPPCPLVKKYLADEFRVVAPSFVDEVLNREETWEEELEVEEEGEGNVVVQVEDEAEGEADLVIREDDALSYFLFDLAGIPRLSEELWHCPRTDGNDGRWVAAMWRRPTRNLCRICRGFKAMFTPSDGEPLMRSRDYDFNTFRACYVEPLEGSNQGLDGERAPYAPTILEIHKGLLSLFRL